MKNDGLSFALSGTLKKWGTILKPFSCPIKHNRVEVLWKLRIVSLCRATEKPNLYYSDVVSYDQLRIPRPTQKDTRREKNFWGKPGKVSSHRKS